jgi:hypothetical protein
MGDMVGGFVHESVALLFHDAIVVTGIVPLLTSCSRLGTDKPSILGYIEELQR